jgi:hypothetical protein
MRPSLIVRVWRAATYRNHPARLPSRRVAPTRPVRDLAIVAVEVDLRRGVLRVAATPDKFRR